MLWKKLFAHTSRALDDNIPLMQAALQQHIKRASLQANCWNQTLVLNPELPSSSDWGWTKEASGWQPRWTTLPEASKSCHELIHCNCKKGCTGRCTCTKTALKCTALCACSADGEVQSDTLTFMRLYDNASVLHASVCTIYMCLRSLTSPYFEAYSLCSVHIKN